MAFVLKEAGLASLFQNVFPELVAVERDLFHGMRRTLWIIQCSNDAAENSAKAVISAAIEHEIISFEPALSVTPLRIYRCVITGFLEVPSPSGTVVLVSWVGIFV